MSTAADHAADRAFWDKLAGAHGQDDYYDTRALIAGQSSLVAEEERALCAAVGDRGRLEWRRHRARSVPHMRVVQLVEHLDVSFDPLSGAVDQERDRRWRLRVDGQALPALFTLRAVRPE